MNYRVNYRLSVKAIQQLARCLDQLTIGLCVLNNQPILINNAVFHSFVHIVDTSRQSTSGLPDAGVNEWGGCFWLCEWCYIECTLKCTRGCGLRLRWMSLCTKPIIWWRRSVSDGRLGRLNPFADLAFSTLDFTCRDRSTFAIHRPSATFC